MLIRIRSKAGMWRVPDLSSTSTIADVQAWVQEQYHIPPEQQLFSKDPQGKDRCAPDKSLASLDIRHGNILYLECEVEISTGKNAVVGKRINMDGSISAITYDERMEATGFRPGLKSLRDMKMYWTLDEFMRMDAEFEYKIERQKTPVCTSVTLDPQSCNSFQSYLRQFAFQQSRCAWLYGSVDTETNAVTVDAIYEPPQEGDVYGFEVFDDPNDAKMEAITTALGLEKVGWVFSHPPREDETFQFSSREILLAAQLQCDAGGAGTPFVTVKVTLDKEGQSSFEAFQVSDQCMTMFSSGALVENPSEPQTCLIHETFTAIVEAKAVKSVDNNFFLCVVPVKQAASAILQTEFPRANREGAMRTREQVGQQLQKLAHLPLSARIADLQLLLFLADFLDLKTDIPVICQSILNPDTVPLDEGYEMILNSVAGRA